jgi:outer membrane lipoprotein LolB
MMRPIMSTAASLFAALHPLRIATLTLALTGCASIAPPPAAPVQGAPTPSAPESRQATPVRTYRDTIDLDGRLSVRYQRNGREEALHGSFTWAQTAHQATVTLLSPLGQTLATIEVTPGHSSLTQTGRPLRVAADVDALAADALGWPLPVAGLRGWLQGFAIDGSGHRVIATPSTTATTVATPDGWRIHYASWQNDDPAAGDPAAARNHPKRIDLERSTAQAGDVSIRIVIDSWQPH